MTQAIYRFKVIRNEDVAYLREEQTVFTRCVADIVTAIIAARDGVRGSRWQTIAKAILDASSNTAVHLLTGLCVNGKVPPSDIAKLTLDARLAVAAALANGERLLTLDDGLRNRHFLGQVFSSANAVFTSHERLVEEWSKERTEWFEAKADFENANTAYMQVKPLFDQFALQHGRLTGRRYRWEQYIDWLATQVELAKWRDSSTVISPIPEKLLVRLKKAKPHRRAIRYADEFFKVNPELKALTDIDHEYRKTFGCFKRKPTLTIPSEKNPVHTRFTHEKTQPGGYFRFAINGSRASLELANRQAEGTKNRHALDLRSDRRLYNASIDGEFVSTMESGRRIRGSMKGLECIVRPSGVYLHLYVDYSGVDKRKVKIVEINNLAGRYKSHYDGWDKDLGRPILKPGTVIVSTDEGIRKMLWVRVHKWDGYQLIPLFSKPIDLPTLQHGVRQAERELNAKKRQRGKPVHGERFHPKLTDHVRQSRDNMVRTLASEVVGIANNFNAHVLVMENLKGMNANSGNTRGHNRNLQSMEKTLLHNHVQAKCGRLGILFQETGPHYTSQRCPSCTRFNSERFSEAGGNGKERFHCLACGYEADAEHVGAGNVAARWVLGWDEFTRLLPKEKKDRLKVRNVRSKKSEAKKLARAA